jgi:hypothetical protein
LNMEHGARDAIGLRGLQNELPATRIVAIPHEVLEQLS